MASLCDLFRAFLSFFPLYSRGNVDNTPRQTGPRKDDLAVYVELDLAENTAKKAMSIRKSRELSEQLENVVLGERWGSFSFRSDAYERRERRHNAAFCKVPPAPRGPSYSSIRIYCATVDLDVSFLTFSRRSYRFP